VRIKVQHATRCADCGARLRVGDDAEWYPPAAGVQAETTCVACPETSSRPTAQTAPVDISSLYEDNGCSSCGQCWAARRSKGGLPTASPCCGAAWVEHPPADEQPRQDPGDDDRAPLRLVVG
jgi:hypothetical protein